MHAIAVSLIAHCRAATHDRGASGVEYGIMLAAIAGVITILAFAVGTKVAAGLSNFDSIFP